MAELDLLRANTNKIIDPALTAEWNKKALVWVPSEKDGFVLAAITKDHADGFVDVEILDTNEKQRVSRDDYQKVNPPRFDKCEDMSDMTCLNEASVLHNLKQRYFANLIYTYSGLFCVVINPYRRLPIYTESIADQFKGKKRKSMPPHIFAVTDEAYRSMLQDREDQAILCTGESGAGKTENTKKVIQYLANVAGSRKSARADLDSSHNRVVGHLEEQLLQANPILEAFGNSKTVKNDNSSRFGKFIRVHFDATGCISGANIEFYLLEKSRVLRQAEYERSFHIFYQLLKGAKKETRADLLLEDDPSAYRFLSNGDVRIAGMEDSKEFEELMKAMDIMAFQDREMHDIFRIVSAVMLFGNLKFGQESKNSEQAVITNDAVAQKIATLLGVNVIDLMKAFLKPKIKIQRDLVHRSQNEEQARFSVEAIAKACYERLFRWLVHRLNKSLDKTRQHSISFVGILDIAGFEIFEMNSFEQLCINYTNEKLQQLFNNTMFVREQQEYLDEGLDWDMIDFGLNLQPTIDLIEKPMGVLSTLDDICLFPQGNDSGFVERLTNQNHQHKKFVVPEMRAKSDFAIVHYAGRVDYSAAGWRVKNMDPLNENVVELLQQSKDILVADIWKDVSDVCSISATEVGDSVVFGARVKKGMFRTVSQLHKENLTRLMSTLSNTNPHFVRCIIPNHEKKHGVLNPHLVLDQLRCNGVLEGIRICRQGYPNRLPFQEFRQRYERLLTPDVVPHGFMDGKEAVRRMVEALEIEPSLFRIGQSKIFFRTGVLAECERMRDEKLAQLMVAFQARVRGVLGRRAFNKRREQEAAIRLIQRNGKAWMRLREWQWWRMYTKVKPLLEVTNKDEIIVEREMALKTTNEKLRRSEVYIQDISTKLGRIDEERQLLQQKLEIESTERAEADEARARVAARKAELEQTLSSLEKQLKTEGAARETAEQERKRLIETVSDLEHQLEEEERRRNTLQLERNQLEQRLKQFDSQKVELEETGGRLSKEKQVLESRFKDVSDRLIDEEEKTKAMTKQKLKLEAQLAETLDELEREKESRGALESAKRGVESELREANEVSAERLRKAEELTQQLLRKETELAQCILKNDEEVAGRQQLEREVRELQTQLEDVQDDLKQEQALRTKAEKARRNICEELEAYKQELEESQDKSALHQELRAKREEELTRLGKQLEDAQRSAEERVETARGKYQKQLEEMGEEMDVLKRQKAAAEKSRVQLESEKADLEAELANARSARTEAEKRRKAADSQLTEQQQKNARLQREYEEMAERVEKSASELAALQALKDQEGATAANLLKKISLLETQLAEQSEANEEHRVSRASLATRLRQAEDSLAAATEHSDDLQMEVEKQEREIASLRSQLAEMKKRLDEEAGEKMEEMRRRLQKEVQEAVSRAEEANVAREKADRYKKKAQEEAEDASRELVDVTAQLREAERKQRKFDQMLADEKAITARVQANLDAAQQQARDAETRQLTMANELEEMQAKMEGLEKERRVLKLEVDNLASNQDDAGKNVFELGKTKRRLEEELAKAQELIIELEDAVQLSDDAKTRLEIQLQAARQEHERNTAQRDQEDEERRRMLTKQVRDLEEELETERRQRSQAAAGKKKADAEVISLQDANDALTRQLDEANRQCRRAYQSAKDAQMEGAEARAAMDEALFTSRDAEKRQRNLESEVSRLSEELAASQHARKKAEMERDDVMEEIQTIKGSAVGQEEKRRLERRVTDLEDQLDEEQTNHEVSMEKMKTAQSQVEKLTTELTQERAICERFDAEKRTLERTVRDLNASLEAAESQAHTRMRAQLATSEARCRQAQEQLEEAERERMLMSRQVRRMERQLAEMNETREEERRRAQQEKDATNSATTRLRQTKRELEDREEELAKERMKLKEARRQLDDMAEQNELVTRENQTLKNRLTAERRNTSGVGLMSSAGRRYGGSSNSIRGDDMRSVNGDEFVRPSSRFGGSGSQYGHSEEDRDSTKN